MKLLNIYLNTYKCIHKKIYIVKAPLVLEDYLGMQ